MTCALIGHRGASGVAPENTLPAFDRAVRDGAHAIECDVRLTKDGAPVLLHDETLTRTANDRRTIAEVTFAEARALEVGYWKGPEWAGTRIPALIEALWWSADAIPLILELKTTPDPERLVDAVARAVQAAPGAKVMTVSSFDFAILAIAARILPDLPRAYISATTMYEDLERARSLGVSALHLAARGMHTTDGPLGLPVYFWTVDDPAHARKLLNGTPFGKPAGIMTNVPATLAPVVAAP